MVTLSASGSLNVKPSKGTEAPQQTQAGKRRILTKSFLGLQTGVHRLANWRQFGRDGEVFEIYVNECPDD